MDVDGHDESSFSPPIPSLSKVPINVCPSYQLFLRYVSLSHSLYGPSINPLPHPSCSTSSSMLLHLFLLLNFIPLISQLHPPNLSTSTCSLNLLLLLDLLTHPS